MRFSHLAAFTLAMAAGATTATAEKFVGYGAIEGWNVYTDTEKKSCIVETKDDFDNVVQMGMTDERDIAYIGIFTKEKTDIKNDSKSEVAILIGENLYVGEATGMRGTITKGYSGGYVLTDDPQVFKDIQRAYTMTVFPEKEYSFVVDLSGTAKALDLAAKCNKEAMQ